MGWMWMHKPCGMTASEFLIHHSGALRWTDSPYDYKVLDSAVVKLKTFYAAVEQVERATGERRVWAAVFLLGFAPKAEYNFGYKDMDETCGPCEAECPERILDLLTETEYQYAIDWRARCRAKIAARRARPKLKPGMTIELYGKPYTVDRSNGKVGFWLRDPAGNPYIATHMRLRDATVTTPKEPS